MRDPDDKGLLDKRDSKVGRFIAALGGVLPMRGIPGGVLTSVLIRFPTEQDPSTLLIIKGEGDAGKLIAFVGAYEVSDALLAWAAKCRADAMKWREDVPWEQRLR